MGTIFFVFIALPSKNFFFFKKKLFSTHTHTHTTPQREREWNLQRQLSSIKEKKDVCLTKKEKESKQNKQTDSKFAVCNVTTIYYAEKD